MGQKVIIKVWWESGLSSASRNHLITFCRLFFSYACLKDCIPQQFTLSETIVFVLSASLISASADRIGYTSNFCSMVELFHEHKNSFFNVEAFRTLIMSQQGKRKTKNFLNYVQQFQNTSSTNFLWGRKLFLRGDSPPWLRACGLPNITKSKHFLAYFIRFSKIRSCKPGCAPASPAAHPQCSTARI